MVHVAVIGASGWIGKKLVDVLIRDGRIGNDRVTHLTLVDVNEPEMPPESNDISVRTLEVDITDPSHVSVMLEDLPQFIFHLAAADTGEAETDFGISYAVTLDGALKILDTIRKLRDYKPRLVYASTLAVSAPPLPERVSGHWNAAPSSLNGMQKAIEELWEDSTRQGVLIAVSIRLPTIVVRPGPPNSAAFSFLSSILREPLHGREAVLPVREDSVYKIASWHAAVGYLLHASLYDPVLPGDRVLTMPGISASVKEMIDTLERVAGTEAVRRIRHEPDPMIIEIMDGRPRHLESESQRARELGFQPDASFEAILLRYKKEKDF